MVAFLHRRSSPSCLMSRLLFKPTPRRATLACAHRSDGDVRATQMRVMCALVAGGSRRRSRAGVDFPFFLSNHFLSALRTPLAIRVPFPSLLRRALVGARAHERAHDARRARCGDVTVRSTRRAGSPRVRALFVGHPRPGALARARAAGARAAGWAPPPPVSVGQRAAGVGVVSRYLRAWCLVLGVS